MTATMDRETAEVIESQPVGTPRTFGVEVECEIDWEHLNEQQEGRYMNLEGVFTHPDTGEDFTTYAEVYVEAPEGDGDLEDEITCLPCDTGCWDVRGDGSLSPEHGGAMREIVSGVLRGAAGIDTLSDLAEILNRYDVRVNRSCGLHVHVGTAHRDGTRASKTQVRALDEVFEVFEYAFYGQAGRYAHARANGGPTGRWCKPKRDSYDEDRYRALNIGSALRGGPTYEVRAFGPTTDALSLIGSVCMAVGIGQFVFSGDAAKAHLPERSLDPRVAMEAFWELVQQKHLPDMPEHIDLADVIAQCHENAVVAARELRFS